MTKVADTARRLAVDAGSRAIGGLLWPRPERFVLILSHMRSGSSLLTHLLASSSEVFGFGESHVRYGDRGALSQLTALGVWYRRRLPPAGSWLLDKVLHNDCGVSEKVFSAADGRFVFLLRRPKATLESLVSLHLFDKRVDEMTAEQALDYYETRLIQLRRYAAALPSSRALFVTYESLLDRPSKVLRELEQLLMLSSPLSEEYKLMTTTGRAGFGDPSRRIQSGRIIRDRAASKVTIPDDILRRASVAHECAMRDLSKHGRGRGPE